MLGAKIFAVASMVLSAFALPADNSGNYTVTIHNNCAAKRSFGAFSINTGSWSMTQLTKTLDLEPKQNGTLSIPFNALGVRVSDQADKGVGAQWNALQLVEFGFSAFSGLIGTAFDISMMGGSDKQNALKVCPNNWKTEPSCQCKYNEPNMAEALKVKNLWRNANEALSGSKADTTCMKGRQDFTIWWC